jgi:hypothetical protein
MAKIIFIIYFLSLNSFSQNKASHKKYSMDFIGGYYTNLNSWKENGVSGGYEFSYMPKTIVYSANISMGFGISKNRNTKDGYIQVFFETDLLAGKKFNLTKSISIIPQSGMGFLHYTNHFQEEKKYIIGFPFQTKIYFFDNKNLSFGLIPRVMINNIQNNYSINFTINTKF